MKLTASLIAIAISLGSLATTAIAADTSFDDFSPMIGDVG